MQGLNNQNYNPVIRPKTLVCYICGREYGTKSLEIHLKTCQEKFLMEEAKKPKNQRRPLPQPPKAIGGNGAYDTDAYNEEAFTAYKEQSLEKCAYCGRTFNRESYTIHVKMCKPDKPFKPLPGFVQNPKEVQQQMNRDNVTGQGGKGGKVPNSYENEYKAPVRPKTLVCYICGREYGTKSLGIHIPQCKEMFITQELKKPKPERRNPPSTPRGLWDILNKDEITTEDIIAYNNGAFNKYNKEALVMCKNCGRTFKPEALEHHAKACTVDKPFQALDTAEEGETVELVPCKKCGRKFLPSRVEKHENACKDIKGANQMQSNGIQKQEQKPQQQQQQVSPSPQPKQQVEQKAPEKVQFSKTAATGFDNSVLKCYKCYQDCSTVSELKTHGLSCKGKGEKPQIFDDLIQLSNPSQALKNIYMNEVQDAMAKNKSPAQATSQPKISTQQKIQKPEPQKVIQQEAEEDENENEFEGLDLVRCEKCDRKFAKDRINKHMKVCKGKTFFEKKEHKVEVQKAEKTGWRKYHDEFIATVKYNRQVKKIQEEGGDIRQLGPPPASSNDNYVPCPYCKRKFDPSKAEKHIQICQNVVNKPKTVVEKKQLLSQQQQPKIPYQPQEQNNLQKQIPSNINPTYGKVFKLDDQQAPNSKLQQKQSVERQSQQFQQKQQPPQLKTPQIAQKNLSNPPSQSTLQTPQINNQFRIRSPQTQQKAITKSTTVKQNDNIFRPPTSGRSNEYQKANSQLHLKPIQTSTGFKKKF